MKQIQRKRFRQGAMFCLGSGMLLAQSLAPALAGSATGTFNFQATFMGGSCTMSSDTPLIQFMDGAGDAISASEIKNNPSSPILTKTFHLTLDNCTGWGGTPKITVDGQSTSLYGPELFRLPQPSSGSDGYGFLVATPGNAYFQPNTNLAENNAILAASSWSTNNQLTTVNNASLPITVTLTCGDCTYEARKGGDLTASVTFNFVYE